MSGRPPRRDGRRSRGGRGGRGGRRGNRSRRGEVVGRISIVQEDRIRVVDGAGRGYLFVVRKRAASLAELEAWRDGGTPLHIRYVGEPDAGAIARRLEPLGGVPGGRG